jgi:hypothetical protein
MNQLLCLAPFVLAAAALAQTPALPKPAAVEGKVANSVTNEPLRKVDLTLSTTMGAVEQMEEALAMFGGGDDTPAPPSAPKTEKKTFQATTDSAGKFRFDHVDPGDYYLTATHASFLDERYKPGIHQGSEGKLHLADGDEMTGIELRMTPQGAVSGKVVDEDGDPIANVIVTAMSVSYASGHRKLAPADVAPCNDRGEFRLGKLPPGHYFVSANAMRVNPLEKVPPLPKDGTPETGYVSTYYPHVTDVSQAAKVEVGAGADLTGFTIQLQKAKVVRIKGQATTAEGAPMKGGEVMLMNPANIGGMQMGMLNSEGRFDLANVQPGTYMLMTMQLGGGKPNMTMQPIVVPDEGLADVKLGAQPEKAVQGRIVTAGDGKVDLQHFIVVLAGDEGVYPMPVLAHATETGIFTAKVAAASYGLTLPYTPPGTYLKSVLLNGRDLSGKPLDFSGGAGDLLVTLGTDGGTVDAAVSLGDKPLFDATVVLLPADPARRFPEATKEKSTDEAGRVTIKDVPPGDYLVFAWEKAEPGAWFDPDYEKSVEKQATKVTVGPKGKEKVEVKAIPRV